MLKKIYKEPNDLKIYNLFSCKDMISQQKKLKYCPRNQTNSGASIRFFKLNSDQGRLTKTKALRQLTQSGTSMEKISRTGKEVNLLHPNSQSSKGAQLALACMNFKLLGN